MDYNSILAQDLTLDETKYQQQGPFYLTDMFAINYFTSFTVIAAVVSHVFLWYGKSIYKQTKAAFKMNELGNGLKDKHNVLMRAYADFPEWVYIAWLTVFTCLSVLVCQFSPIYIPFWASLFAILMGCFFTIPIGIVQAIAGFQVGLNVLTEFLIGLAIPGQTLAVIGFKSLGYNVVIQALNLVSDLKLGHYMHISPITMVFGQVLGTVIGIIFNTFGAFFVLDKMSDILGTNQWQYPGYATFLSAAGIWGCI